MKFFCFFSFKKRRLPSFLSQFPAPSTPVPFARQRAWLMRSFSNPATLSRAV